MHEILKRGATESMKTPENYWGKGTKSLFKIYFNLDPHFFYVKKPIGL